MEEAYPLSGGCHCGSVRYEVRAAPSMSGYCHCRNCQRLTGTPAMVWAQVPIAAFCYTAGEPAIYLSSETGERRFCGHCGSPLEFRRRPDPQTVEFYVATLDDPARVVPRVHIFTRSRIPWFDTADTLPRLREFT
jgi:hypothetical protein